MRQKRGWQVSSLTGMLLCGLWFSLNARADVNVYITATILAPVCTVTDIRGSHQTVVDFGTVPVEKVSGVGERLDKSHTLGMKVSCDGPAPVGKVLKMKITPTGGGTMSYSGRTVLGTSLAGLGIDLIHVTSTQPSLLLNTWVPAEPTADGIVGIVALLVSNNVAALKGGGFTSSASLVMDYQ
ncbi:fimbrial protein [Salmonella enterica]|nr:fimbrial protein [Salmonella enterica]ECD4514761.1 fimbrial protein [Salmonella enterica subsp. enterica serovar Sandiego]ECF1356159.1 fimbrial protein [Salmonella enterica subsp. enterica serovar Sandiego]ECV4068503.1 fimbrial protein [Salmonella enterica]ECZ0995773.1 fimbrial protein [Salmonella enterica]